jgi:16S rRNA (guanine966-N2)-methyltransferase
MRIIAGNLKGRKLESPRSLPIRPATDRVRESVFNLIASRRSFESASVLDLFCGTGAIGLEAVSRGAANVTFVDLNRDAIRLTRRNAENLGVADRATFLVRDGLRFLARDTVRYDLIFADPPYHLDDITSIPVYARPRLLASGLLFLEHDRHHDFSEFEGRVESRKYGRTIVSIFDSMEQDA